MSAKKLDQSVFEGLPKEYQWAVFDRGGTCVAFSKHPHYEGGWYSLNNDVFIVGYGYNSDNWQNSLIERQDVPTADIDWSRQEVPAGATHYSPETDATHECFYKDNFKQMWLVKMTRIGWQDASVSEHERPIAIPTKPEPQVDWSKAPEGATHINTHGQFLRKHDQIGWMQFWGSDWIAVKFTESDIAAFREIPNKPESITDVARSIEAARVEERQNALAWDAIDWNSAPKGATHAIYEHDFVLWLQQQPSGSWLGQTALGDVWDKLSGEPEGFVFERPESITEIPYGVKAARVAEQAERTYPHYFKDVSGVDAIDLYHVAKLYEITDPALFHAFKKIACAGKRGAKDQAQDVQEAIDALKRWQELSV